MTRLIKKQLVIHYPCEALVDQGKFIGASPIGYQCTQEAEWEIGGVMLCESCRQILIEDAERLSFPPGVLETPVEKRIELWKKSIQSFWDWVKEGLLA